LFNYFFLTDVQTIPVNGTWFQLIGNGTTSVNTGANGLQKLDTVIKLAEKHGLFVQLALTNNWNPEDKINASPITGTNNSLPRNVLSNNYGRQFINSLVFELKGTVQEGWMPTSERLVILPSSLTTNSIQIQRFLMPS